MHTWPLLAVVVIRGRPTTPWPPRPLLRA
jgi:hypothetical protein